VFASAGHGGRPPLGEITEEHSSTTSFPLITAARSLPCKRRCP
jgi:hypothetical protein